MADLLDRRSSGTWGLRGPEKSIDGGGGLFWAEIYKTDRKHSLARVIYLVYSATGRTFQNAKLKLKLKFKLFERDVPHGIIIMGRVLFRSTGSGTGALNEHRFWDSRGKILNDTGVL